MSVLIKGMEMPKSCGRCRFAGVCGVHPVDEWPDLESIFNNDVIGVDGERDKDCPLIPVPPHGRLIDADALPINAPIRSMMVFGGEIVIAKSAIDDAPTVIPASKEGE